MTCTTLYHVRYRVPSEPTYSLRQFYVLPRVTAFSATVGVQDITAEMELTYLKEKAHKKEDRLLEDAEHEHNHEDHEHDEHEHEHDAAEVQSSANAAGDKPWGAVLGATFLVNLATLTGVVLIMVPVLYKGVLKLYGAADPNAPLTKGGKIFHIGLPGFAVGALLGAVVFLVVPEALHMIGGGHDESHDGHDHRFLEEAHDDHGDHAAHGNDEGVIAAKFGCKFAGFQIVTTMLQFLNISKFICALHQRWSSCRISSTSDFRRLSPHHAPRERTC